LDDFAAAKGEYVTPISCEFRGLTVYECPPNGQGLIALLLLNMMSVADIQPGGPLSVERIHFEIEACRLAYAVRDRYLADPEHAQLPVEQILSESYARQLVAQIDPQTCSHPVNPISVPEHKDTVYISVVDKDRNVCSFINTLFWAFGSGITSTDGITLTNRGMGFSMDPKSPNCMAPRKRPLHTIIPGIASRGDHVELCFGVMGGEYQAMGHQQFMTRYADFGCDVQEAMDLPRFMADPSTGVVEVETLISAGVRESLTAKGHTVTQAVKPVGGSQAIQINWTDNVLTGGSDHRKDGCAAGY
jgi:gamma-glutamyltranspeptidase/glutathione hydrolase